MRIYWRYILLLAELQGIAKPKSGALCMEKEKKIQNKKGRGHMQYIDQELTIETSVTSLQNVE